MTADEFRARESKENASAIHAKGSQPSCGYSKTPTKQPQGEHVGRLKDWAARSKPNTQIATTIFQAYALQLSSYVGLIVLSLLIGSAIFSPSLGGRPMGAWMLLKPCRLNHVYNEPSPSPRSCARTVECGRQTHGSEEEIGYNSQAPSWQRCPRDSGWTSLSTEGPRNAPKRIWPRTPDRTARRRERLSC